MKALFFSSLWLWTGLVQPLAPFLFSITLEVPAQSGKKKREKAGYKERRKTIFINRKHEGYVKNPMAPKIKNQELIYEFLYYLISRHRSYNNAVMWCQCEDRQTDQWNPTETDPHTWSIDLVYKGAWQCSQELRVFLTTALAEVESQEKGHSTDAGGHKDRSQSDYAAWERPVKESPCGEGKRSLPPPK